MSAEADRLRAADDGTASWRTWGPYVAERAWGTVREDYSADGSAWDYFPHDHARSRAYRWNEDGMAAVCDEDQRLCLGLAVWNGRDPILKERMFGLAGHEGNHGEDVKEYWWYLDSTPTHSWLTWRYHYPQEEFPYGDLVTENARRGMSEGEYELVDTGVFADGRFWAVTVDYAKATPDDILMRITVENCGPEDATIHVLPTAWFRNTWAWGRSIAPVPVLQSAGRGEVRATHEVLGVWTLAHDPEADVVFCDNETNTRRLFGASVGPAFPKDGINDHIVVGAATVNPDLTGTKASVHHVVSVPAGHKREIRVRLSAGALPGDLGGSFAEVMSERRSEADEFYADLCPSSLSTDEGAVVRQAMAGLLWGKQFFHFDVEEWRDGDPSGPTPPPRRARDRNAAWSHLSAHDVISMPDPWEYPWFAAWDLAFHCVPLAHVDGQFAKDQLLLLLREWYMHPNGQLPAYEWAFGDVNPPVHAWAALQVFQCTGAADYEFLERVFHKLLLNFTWWVNRKDMSGLNLFEGGFLGLDNIGPIDRSGELPIAGELQQSDGTAWMAMYCLDMLEIALVLARHDSSYEDMTTKFLEHFAYIASAARSSSLWDEEDGFFYDVLVAEDGRRFPLRVRSLVGLLPITATTTLGRQTLARLPGFAASLDAFIRAKPQHAAPIAQTHLRDGHEGRLLSLIDPRSLVRILGRLFDPGEFLSPHGVRSLSRHHLDNPFVLRIGDFQAAVGYEPAESQTGAFGGNSNWRGPIWLPANILLIQALRRFARYYGDDVRVEFPTGSGRSMSLNDAADELASRVVELFIPDSTGRRASQPDMQEAGSSDAWRDLIAFYEYFDAETGAGLGASHQTGWTALVAELLLHRQDPRE
ncbi:MAG: glucosidase [Actinomycetales bacterium]|nr:glucosidase [Actinomycetales bacterium]